jgi:scyllo-inositol 2-dehydrogenase (NADP+)
VLFWFGRPSAPFTLFSVNRFENLAPDHVSFGSNSNPLLQMEVTLLSWRNYFYCDILAENGSAHIESLCKWGPSTLTVRNRKFPSGRPDEESITLLQPDPTWEAEYQHFKALCGQGNNNIENDIWINDTLCVLNAEACKC